MHVSWVSNDEINSVWILKSEKKAMETIDALLFLIS